MKSKTYIKTTDGYDMDEVIESTINQFYKEKHEKGVYSLQIKNVNVMPMYEFKDKNLFIRRISINIIY